MKDSQRKAMFAKRADIPLLKKPQSEVTFDDISKIVPTRTGTHVITSVTGVTVNRGKIKHHDAKQLKFARKFNDVLIQFDNNTSQFLPRDIVVIDAGLPKDHPAMKEFKKFRQKETGKEGVSNHRKLIKRTPEKDREFF